MADDPADAANLTDLDLAAKNDSRTLSSVVSAIKLLRLTIDNLAVRTARANANWHDDPTADDHALFHAEPIVQYPRAARDAVILDLVSFYLSELSIQDKESK